MACCLTFTSGGTKSFTASRLGFLGTPRPLAEQPPIPPDSQRRKASSSTFGS